MNITAILAMNNRDFASSVKKFRSACDRAGVSPTKRQAAKWRRKKGAAYSKVNGGAV